MDFETRLGTTWTLRVGLAILAIALALFARSVVPSMTAGTKVALAYVGAIVLFATGKIFEERLQRFARPVMAGGLAFGFFVSFAAHFVPAMRAVSLVVSLVWMAVSVAAILLTAERWKSQPTAGMAIFLGHVAAFVAAGDADVYSLIVIAFLSLAALGLLLRHSWLPLSLFAVVAAYASHLLWTLVEHAPTPPELALVLNLVFLSSYYVMFLAADLIWWRRFRAQGEEAFTPGQQKAGRALGPTNVTLYASLASFLYVASNVQLARAEWFFFSIAITQGALTVAYRKLDNRDYAFYAALGTVLATAGFFVMFDALTLNVVLASEALVLLLAADRTKLRVFVFLSQAALALNFFHYWFFDRPETVTTVMLVGGMVVVCAYMVKAWLEERWDLPPVLPWLSAFGGGVILIDQLGAHFSDQTVVSVLIGAIVVATTAGLMGRVVAVLVASVAWSAGIVVVTAGGVVPEWSVWMAGTVGIGAAGIVAALAGVRYVEGRKVTTALVLSHGSVWMSMVLLAIGAGTAGVATVPYVLWIGSVALVYVHQVKATKASSLDGIRHRVQRRLMSAGIAEGLGAALLAVYATEQVTVVEWAAPVYTVVWSVVVFFVALALRSVPLYVSSYALLATTYVYSLVARDLAGSVAEHPLAASAIVLGTLAFAVGRDWIADSDEDTRRGRWRAVSTAVLYLAGLGFLDFAVGRRMPFPWFVAATTLAPLALAVPIPRLSLRVAPVAALMFSIWMLLRYFNGALSSGAGAEDLLLPAVVFATELVAIEWFLSSQSRRVARDGAWFGTPARLFLIAMAAVVAMSAAYQSDLLGPRWATAGWSVVAGLMMTFGFAIKSSIHRRVALAVFAASLVRVFVVDTKGLSDTTKTLAFFTLGLSLVAVAWLYARYASELKKWL
jgi:hypothetical protein